MNTYISTYIYNYKYTYMYINIYEEMETCERESYCESGASRSLYKYIICVYIWHIYMAFVAHICGIRVRHIYMCSSQLQIGWH